MTTHEEALEALGKKPKEKKKETYISQEGWKRVPVYRGFTEISQLYDMVYKRNGIILGGYVPSPGPWGGSVCFSGAVFSPFPPGHGRF